MISVYPCGTPCRPKLQNFKAIVTGIEIVFNNVMYRLAYFNGNEYTELWLNENEVEFKDKSEKTNIGFNNVE